MKKQTTIVVIGSLRVKEGYTNIYLDTLLILKYSYQRISVDIYTRGHPRGRFGRKSLSKLADFSLS